MVDHKVLNDGGESRDNHRYAVVVQDRFNLIRAKKGRTLKILEPTQALKVVNLDQIGGDVKFYHGTIDPRQRASLKKAFRRVKEATPAVLLQSGLDVRLWSDSMECYCHMRNLEAQRNKSKVHFASLMDMSSQECGVRTPISEVQKVESYSVVILLKTTLELMQSSLNKARLRHR